MNLVKKIFASIVFIFTISSTVFAASGFEANLTVPFGANLGMHNFEGKETIPDSLKKEMKYDSSIGGFLVAIMGKELLLNPIFAALAMSLSSICVVFNALRLNLFRVKY